ncbi:MAG: PEP-CTERM sorting domain-containing protein [Planctomycetes bacterium]|nr:PEP-CTERM sorting domain-containing protein [Planctomycetota bacterium]
MKYHLLSLVLLSSFGSLQAGVIVPGTSDPKLAGMPDGAEASNFSVAPGQSPVEFTGFPLVAGQRLLFSVTGTVSNGDFGSTDGPEGNASNVGPFNEGSENGISNITAPINALLGIFLGPDQPDLSPAPAALSFATLAERDFLELLPELKQVFFIGNGRTSLNATQTFVVPVGATRLFLATMDFSEYPNNSGAFDVEMSAVPEPATFACFGALGLVLLGGGLRANRHRKLTDDNRGPH